MIMELYHNQILSLVITEKFAESVRVNLLDKLSEKYGEEYLGIVMYEDFLCEKFEREGVWYYPLTVRTTSGSVTEWICWDVSDSASFKDGIPYSYVGEGLVEFAYANYVPAEFSEALSGRAIDFDENTVKTTVQSVNSSAAFLSGKYSQTFLDLISSEVTRAIESQLSVAGLSESSFELVLVLADGTYMEHTSEAKTYRRFLLTDKGCQARDFWIKWTRLDSAVSYSITDTPAADTVEIELGEDVPQKIREKEFRFLCGTNPSKYQSAMGKKTVTEWRELIKRALKKGSLIKVQTVAELDNASVGDDEELKALLNSIGVTAAPTGEEPKVSESADFERALEMAREALSERENEIARDSAVDFEISEPFEILPENEIEAQEELEPDFTARDSTGEEEFALPGDWAPKFDLEIEPEEEPVDESLDAMKIAEENHRREVEAELARQRKEALSKEADAKARLRYEAEARRAAEAEAARLRDEQERLRSEVERLTRLAKIAEENRRREQDARQEEAERNRLEIERRRKEEEKLREQIENQLKQEARERERLSEAARLAVLEQQQKERQQKADEENLRQAEADRVLKEEQARREAERVRLETLAKAAAQKEQEYMSKQAKLLFRRRADLGVIKSIQSIVEDTLIKNNKQSVHIYMKAYPVDDYTINIDIIKMPKNEADLLVAIIKAIGNGGLGITKIILEDLPKK